MPGTDRDERRCRISVLVAYGATSEFQPSVLRRVARTVVADADAELIVVDDGTSPEVATALAQFGETMVLLHHHTPYGARASLRRAAEIATGELLVLAVAGLNLEASDLEMFRVTLSTDPGVGTVTFAGDAGASRLVAIRRDALASVGGLGVIDGSQNATTDEETTSTEALVSGEVLAALQRAGWRSGSIRALPSGTPGLNPWSHDEDVAVPARLHWVPPLRASSLRSGINVVGLLDAVCGVGDAARRYVEAIEASGITYTTHSFHGHIAPDFPYVHHDEDRFDLDTNLIVLNPDVLIGFAGSAGSEPWFGRYTIGVWFWELEQLNASIKSTFTFVNELWTSSKFLQRAFQAATDRTVVTIPLPVRERDGRPKRTRRELGLPDAFTFLTIFDFGSIALRKNSIGVVRAFCAAFAPGEGPVLVLKTMNAGMDPRSWNELQREIAGRRDVVVLDGYLGDEEVSELIGSADCYVSLHRAEGFGLTPAEAMAWGRPVIATAYSGNLDFMNEQNSYLAPFDLVSVDRSVAAIYPPSARWAEPRQQAASELLRHVYEHREEAAARGEQGRRDIRRSNSVAAASSAIARRFATISEQRARFAHAEPGGGRELIWTGGGSK